MTTYVAITDERWGDAPLDARDDYEIETGRHIVEHFAATGDEISLEDAIVAWEHYSVNDMCAGFMLWHDEQTPEDTRRQLARWVRPR